MRTTSKLVGSTNNRTMRLIFSTKIQSTEAFRVVYIHKHCNFNVIPFLLLLYLKMYHFIHWGTTVRDEIGPTTGWNWILIRQRSWSLSKHIETKKCTLELSTVEGTLHCATGQNLYIFDTLGFPPKCGPTSAQERSKTQRKSYRKAVHLFLDTLERIHKPQKMAISSQT